MPSKIRSRVKTGGEEARRGVIGKQVGRMNRMCTLRKVCTNSQTPCRMEDVGNAKDQVENNFHFLRLRRPARYVVRLTTRVSLGYASFAFLVSLGRCGAAKVKSISDRVLRCRIQLPTLCILPAISARPETAL